MPTPRRAAPGLPGPALRPGLVLLGILLVAANLRAAITVVGPLLGDVRADLGLSGVVASALISLPLVCFAAFSPVAPALARRLGMEPTLALSLLALAVGVVLRSVPWVPGLWVGTVLLGLAIAVMNVILPAVLKRDFPQETGRLTGAYSAVQAACAAAASGLAVPLAGTTPGGWRTAFGVWAGLALVGLAVLAPQLRRRTTASSAVPAEPARPALRPRGPSPWRAPLAWQVTVFMGLQSTLFYTVLAWWPSVEEAHGTSSSAAGLHQGLMQLCGIVASLATAALLHRAPHDQRPLATLLVPLPAVAILGELVLPGLAVVWNVLLGLGAGGLIVLALALFGLRTREHEVAARLSGMAQSMGYLLAAGGPLAIGALHDATGSWTLPLVVLLVLQAVQLGAARLATRPRFLGD